MSQIRILIIRFLKLVSYVDYNYIQIDIFASPGIRVGKTQRLEYREPGPRVVALTLTPMIVAIRPVAVAVDS
ncbi:MAG: hypothetical protein OEW93_11515, partial [Candidatus Bathyarchaeota archaeon]|nr:hypothetical protein [Candidatus Bathyarchaeota archaeon]